MPLRKSHQPVPRHALRATAIVAAAVAVPASSAHAAATLSQNLTCPTQTSTQPFAKWGDKNYYWLAPGGSFESSMAGWGFDNAKVASGNESLGVKSGSKSLQIGGDSTRTVGSATTPSFCVDPTQPHFKFVYRSADTATVTTSITFTASTGAQLTVPAKLNSYSIAGWTISDNQPLSTAIPQVFLGTGTTATLKSQAVTAKLGTSVSIDNLFVDPYRRG